MNPPIEQPGSAGEPHAGTATAPVSAEAGADPAVPHAPAELPGYPGPGPGPSPARSLVQLVVVSALVAALAVAAGLGDLLLVIVAIVVMVMVHELGHFATAKWSGMKVTEYFLGFGPRLWSVRRGETEYGVKAIPAGGYVKIVGMSTLEEVDPEDEPRAYRQQAFHKRVIVASAGSFMHLVMALLLLWSLFAFVGVADTHTISVQALSPLAHGADPARDAGIRAGDQIVSVDGSAVTSFGQLTTLVGRNVGRPLDVVVRRGGRLVDLTVTPQAYRTGGKTVGRIGVLLDNASRRLSPVSSIGHAFTQLGSMVSGTVSLIVHKFSPSGLAGLAHLDTNSQAAQQAAQTGNRPESIVGVVRTAAQSTQYGIGAFLYILALINVSIGLLNMLPMLPLDGGHVAIAVYERIRSRRGRMYHADVAKLMPVVYAFLLVLAFVVVSATYLDIVHPITLPK